MTKKKVLIQQSPPQKTVTKPLYTVIPKHVRESFSVVPTVFSNPPKLPECSVFQSWKVENTEEKIARFVEAWARIGGETTVLYHGTPHKNIASICSDGLVCGNHGMFGGGIYLGLPRKAMAYACRTHEQTQFTLLVVEAILGTSHKVMDAQTFTKHKLEKLGAHSVFAQEGKTHSWGGKLSNHEWVVYDPDQVLVTGILEYVREKTEWHYPCQIAKQVDKSGQFADVLSWFSCGQNSDRKLIVRDKKGKTISIDVCNDCIRDFKMMVGSKVVVHQPAYRAGKTKPRWTTPAGHIEEMRVTDG